MSKKKKNKKEDTDVSEPAFELFEEDGQLKGRIHIKVIFKRLKKIWKKIKKFFKLVYFRIIFFFNPKSKKIKRKYKRKFSGEDYDDYDYAY